MFKKIARKLVVAISWSITKDFINNKKPLIIGVVGSVGKTGTKRAIASILSSSKEVAWQDGNYNDLVTVPLVFFGLSEPSLYNPFAWIKTFMQMKHKAKSSTIDVVVLELGTDGKGQIAEFGKYLNLDMAVVTSISHEHMEFFGTIEAVAEEELAVLDFANKVYIEDDAISFVKDKSVKIITYGFNKENHVTAAFKIEYLTIKSNQVTIKARPKLSGTHQFAALAVASDIALSIGISADKVKSSIEMLESMPGRMNILPGKENSLLIDDTYNSSPKAVKKALEYLYQLPEKNKIAVLGNMNEMGAQSKQLHLEIADFCEVQKLKEVYTIGQEANKTLAPELSKKGIKTKVFESPFDIGQELLQKDLTDTAILFKGSQNGVFLEEAVKLILLNSEDKEKLVRQSAYWMKIKHKQFDQK